MTTDWEEPAELTGEITAPGDKRPESLHETAVGLHDRSGSYTAVSYCRICEPLCGTLVDEENGRLVSIKGDPDHPSSQGYLCPKGSAMALVVNDPQRVLGPLRGDGAGNFEPVSWDAALVEIAERTQALIREHGPESVAYYSGNPAGYGMPGHMWA
jgi:formate dehydrogenase